MAREDGVRFMGNRGLVFDARMLFVAFAALLVWVLMAAPAFAQDAAAQAGDDGAQAGDVEFQAVDCSQVQAALANQYNSGDASAVAVQYGNGDITAGIAQALGISQAQANACLAGNEPGDVGNPGDVKAGTISKSPLPDTGGVPLPAAVFGLALVAAGILSAGALVRRGR